MNKKKNNTPKINRLSKWLIGTAGLFLIVMVVCIISLNKNEKPHKPEVEETPVISISSDDSDGLAGDVSMNVSKEEFPESDKYHGTIRPFKTYSREELPRIVCWGDSLTETSDGKTAYPDVLKELTGTTVINYGLHSDNTRQIAVREGAIPLFVSECIIPAETVPIEVNVTLKSGKVTGLLTNGSVGVNPCMIGSVRGNLELSGKTFYFTRAKEGEITPVTQGTRLSTYGALNKDKNDVVVLFSGANDGLSIDGVPSLIENQRMILDDIGSDEYIIIGPTYADETDNLSAINNALAEEYGEHFLNAHEYLVKYGLLDAGISPTSQDEADMASDYIPESLRIDYVHGTPDYYRLLANQVYRKLMYLGYLPLADEYKESGLQKRVVCWGDSLTEGTGGDGMTYPIAIENAAKADGKNVEVLNYGVFAEESSLIAARAGGNPMRLRDPVLIPADCSPVEIVPISDKQGYEMLLVFGGDKESNGRGPEFIGDNSVNPCILCGVEGRITINPADGTRYFTRLTPGKAVNANTSDPIQFWAMRDKREDDILVIWSGNNDSPTPKSIYSTIDYINSIIEYTGTDKYVVVNFVKIEEIPEIDKVNEIMAKEYGEHLVDIRSYLRNEALSDAGITPTKEDQEFLDAGRMPRSLFSEDVIHYTYRGYELVGEKIYEKLCELGYL